MNDDYKDECPKEPGIYLMTCEETPEPEEVPVYEKTIRGDKMLLCDLSGVGDRYPVSSVHDGLTNARWKKNRLS